MTPSVTVVTPVHNCMPYLEDTLASVYHQSLDRAEVEMVVVDDGSTDGSAECLARWAERWPQLTVVTQEASGSASRPRNVGIEHARGEYLFFLDGDDCLAPMALERLLAIARRNESDVVLAKIVGVNRKAPGALFRKDVDRADFSTGIYWSLVPFKLVRRSMVLQHDLRFPEHMRVSEDQLFVAGCYFAAKRISVLASYDCYYLVRRRDGSNTSFEGLDYPTILRQAAENVALVRAETGPGEVRDRCLARHLKVELLRRINSRFLAADEQAQREMVELARPYAVDWGTPSVLASFRVPDRLQLLAVQQGAVDELRTLVGWVDAGAPARVRRRAGSWVVEAPLAGRFPAEALRTYDDPQPVAGVDEVWCDRGQVRVVGHALLRGVDSADATVTVLARHRRTEAVREAVLTTRPTPYLNALEGHGVVDHTVAGFVAELDLAGARPGRWDLVARLVVGDHEAEIRLRAPVGPPDAPEETTRVVAGAGGNLLVEVSKSGR